MQQLSLQNLNVDVRNNNNVLKKLNDYIDGLLYLGLNIITFRTIIFRTVITFKSSSYHFKLFEPSVACPKPKT